MRRTYFRSGATRLDANVDPASYAASADIPPRHMNWHYRSQSVVRLLLQSGQTQPLYQYTHITSAPLSMQGF